MLFRSLCLGFTLSLAACGASAGETNAGAGGPQVPAPPPAGEGAWLEGTIAKDDAGYRITDTQGNAHLVEDSANAQRLPGNVGRRARVSVWWPGSAATKAKVGTVTVLQVMDGPEIDAARLAIDRFQCAAVGTGAANTMWLEDGHSGRESRFKIFAERADKSLVLVWLDRDPRDPSRLAVASAFVSQGKTLAPLCA